MWNSFRLLAIAGAVLITSTHVTGNNLEGVWVSNSRASFLKKEPGDDQKQSIDTTYRKHFSLLVFDGNNQGERRLLASPENTEQIQVLSDGALQVMSLNGNLTGRLFEGKITLQLKNTEKAYEQIFEYYRLPDSLIADFIVNVHDLSYKSWMLEVDDSLQIYKDMNIYFRHYGGDLISSQIIGQYSYEGMKDCQMFDGYYTLESHGPFLFFGFSDLQRLRSWVFLLTSKHGENLHGYDLSALNLSGESKFSSIIKFQKHPNKSLMELESLQSKLANTNWSLIDTTGNTYTRIGDHLKNYDFKLGFNSDSTFVLSQSGSYHLKEEKRELNWRQKGDYIIDQSGDFYHLTTTIVIGSQQETTRSYMVKQNDRMEFCPKSSRLGHPVIEHYTLKFRQIE